MAKDPWERWIPGVLSQAQVRELCSTGLLSGVTDDAYDPSSIDLTLSEDAYALTHGSVKPGDSNYLFALKRDGLVTPLRPDADGHFLLSPKKTYLFKLEQRFSLLQRISNAGIHGQATAKSSIGRLDILARLVVDGMHGYEGFDPAGIGRGTGDMYLEITPLTFAVEVQTGIALSQLRLFYGSPADAEISGDALWRTVFPATGSPEGKLSLNLEPTDVGGLQAVAFSSKRDVPEPIRLWPSSAIPPPDPCRYWKVHVATTSKRLPITPGDFYILRSKERMWIPPGVAVYCRASDETIGEMRIHYAGFVHPYFGSGRKDSQLGTPLIFEVRGHDFLVNLEDGEQMARLTFFRMSDDAGEVSAPAYTDQQLQLSKFFASWPPVLTADAEGNVSPSTRVTS